MRLIRWLLAFSLPIIICLAIGSEAKAMRYLTVADMPSMVQWGPMSQGLRLSLNLNQTRVRAGEPVLATIALENLGPDRDVALGCNGEDWYDVGIVDSQGQVVSHKFLKPRDCYATASSSPLEHDWVLEVTVRLDDKFNINDTGSYTVTATSTTHLSRAPPNLDSSGSQTYDNPILASLVSNAVKIDVQPQIGANEFEFPSNQPVPAAFKPIIADLQIRTRVPILLPIRLVDAPNTIIGEIVNATPSSYTVQMSMGTQCHKGLYCRFGMLQAVVISATMPPLTGKPIAFEPGISGYFTPATCGANCDDSNLAFDYKGSRYIIGVEAGKMADVLLLAQSLSLFDISRATPRARTLNPVFSPIIGSLRARTNVPLWLPTALPENDLPVYARLGNVTATSFEIILERDRACRGATVRQYGAFYANPPGRNTPLGVRVRLANGVTAHFLLAKCGASCGSSVLTWDIGDVRYSEALKAGNEAEMVSEANSVGLF